MVGVFAASRGVLPSRSGRGKSPMPSPTRIMYFMVLMINQRFQGVKWPRFKDKRFYYPKFIKFSFSPVSYIVCEEIHFLKTSTFA
jgi:hypothetical protein